MYSILLSQLNKTNKSVKEEIKALIKENSKVVIIPWALKEELDSERFQKFYFDICEKGYIRYKRNMEFLSELGIKEDNVTVLNCYKDSREHIVEQIEESDILLLPGGNPEMLFKKVVYDKEILYAIKNYKKIVIGESAGAVVQFEKYFLTKENNSYYYLEYYNGFGLIKNNFYIDVHTKNKPEYIENLKKTSDDDSATIYAIFDEGGVIYNRETRQIEYSNNVIKI